MFVLFSQQQFLMNAIAVVKLNTTNSDIVSVSKEDGVYLTKFKNGKTTIQQHMTEKDWQFEDQLGSGYIFKKNGKKIVITSEQFSKYYTIWKIPEDVQ